MQATESDRFTVRSIITGIEAKIGEVFSVPDDASEDRALIERALRTVLERVDADIAEVVKERLGR